MTISGTLIEQFLEVSRQQATGKWVIASATQQWQLYFFLGRLLYATGGEHRVRRWYRAMEHFCPQLHLDPLTLSLPEPWEYHFLTQALNQEQITITAARAVVQFCTQEVLFSVLFQQEVQTEWLGGEQLPCQIVLQPVEQALQNAQQQYQEWLAAHLGGIDPCLVPVIQQPEVLQRRVGPQVYQNLARLLDGDNTLWDLAIKMQRSVVTVTHSLLPLLGTQILKLQVIADLPSPQAAIASVTSSSTRPLIACIDDSPTVGEAMNQILTPLGYQVLPITDPLRAIATLLQRKPDLIFLDLVMPETNGYEICSQLRKISLFQETPIIILSGNDGLVDQVRARLLGATDFLSKPMEPIVILNIIQKYLGQLALV